MAVAKLVPINEGLVHAILWTGNAKDLADLPGFNDIVTRVTKIDHDGSMVLIASDKETNVRPYKDWVVVDGQKMVYVWTKEFVEKNYKMVDEVVVSQGPVKREMTDDELNKHLWPDHKEGGRDNRVGRTLTILPADRPDDI